MKQNNSNELGKTSNQSRGKKNNRSKGKGKPKFDNKKLTQHDGSEKLNSGYSDGDVNNPSYYYEDVNVLSQVMNFSFNEFGGVPFDIYLGRNATATVHNHMLATYALNPSIPQCTANTVGMDGATTAALRNFLALSGSNAKTTNYAPQDVIILTLALAEIIKMTTFTARAFGVAYLFNYRNRSYPEMLIEAMGINHDDFSKNLATYRVRFNKLLTVASKIPFPADLPVFRKAADLYAYIYVDDPNSALAQTYMFIPKTTWTFNEAYDANGAGLETTYLWTNGNKMSDLLDLLETMISALVNSTSLNAIYSDVMRLVQNGKLSQLITFKSIPEDFVVIPTYNEEVRDWIHNALILGEPLPTASQVYNAGSMDPLTNQNDVSCDANSNRLLYHPQFALPNGFFGPEAVIDFTHDNVTYEDKVRGTRLSQRFTVTHDGSTPYNYYTNNLAMSDEYLVEVMYFTGENDIPTTWLTQSYNDTANSSFTLDVAIKTADLLSKFDWSPLYYVNNVTHLGGNSMSIIGDLDYYTLMDFETVKKIYDYEIIHFLQIG